MATLGGPGAQLPLAGARTRASCQVACYDGRWLWRPVAAEPVVWKALAPGTRLDCGGKVLVAQKDEYTHF